MSFCSPAAAELAQRPYFFDAGMRFECQRCGRCCTGRPGKVRVDGQQIQRIASFLKLSDHDFAARFLRCKKTLLIERADGSCVFYRHGCRIYPVRPAQCRTFPFWFSLMRNQHRWLKMATECPGIGKGPCYTKEQILERIAQTMHFSVETPDWTENCEQTLKRP